jgi:hypothetical protein
VEKYYSFIRNLGGNDNVIGMRLINIFKVTISKVHPMMKPGRVKFRVKGLASILRNMLDFGSVKIDSSHGRSHELISAQIKIIQRYFNPSKKFH